jgi:hypothetical protein
MADATRVPNPDQLRPHRPPHLRRGQIVATSLAPAMAFAGKASARHHLAVKSSADWSSRASVNPRGRLRCMAVLAVSP